MAEEQEPHHDKVATFVKRAEFEHSIFGKTQATLQKSYLASSSYGTLNEKMLALKLMAAGQELKKHGLYKRAYNQVIEHRQRKNKLALEYSKKFGLLAQSSKRLARACLQHKEKWGIESSSQAIEFYKEAVHYHEKRLKMLSQDLKQQTRKDIRIWENKIEYVAKREFNLYVLYRTEKGASLNKDDISALQQEARLLSKDDFNGIMERHL